MSFHNALVTPRQVVRQWIAFWVRDYNAPHLTATDNARAVFNFVQKLSEDDLNSIDNRTRIEFELSYEDQLIPA